jgi:hypothetical protein
MSEKRQCQAQRTRYGVGTRCALGATTTLYRAERGRIIALHVCRIHAKPRLDSGSWVDDPSKCAQEARDARIRVAFWDWILARDAEDADGVAELVETISDTIPDLARRLVQAEQDVPVTDARDWGEGVSI